MKPNFFMFFLILISCKIDSKKEEEIKSNPLAKVENNFLYLDDLIIPDNKYDSSKFVAKQINDWIKNEIILLHAYNNINDRIFIDKKLKKYEDDLILYQYENELLSNNVNFIISDLEISKYYNENIKDFILGSKIVRCLYTKIPLGAPEIINFKKLIKRYPQSNINDIKSYSFQFAEQYFLDDSVWLDFDDLIINTPFIELDNGFSYLINNRFLENQDDMFYYFIKIIDYKTPGDISPISFEYDIIKAILLNDKKKELLNKLQDSIYLKFIDQVDYEVY
tara:strand:+ start:916 stop:1752 length:837 start_codon:yes stop_codon:yes gene_type:complete